MSDIRIKKRGRLREKEIKALSEEISQKVGIQVFTLKDTIDKAESSDFDVIFDADSGDERVNQRNRNAAGAEGR